MISPPSVNASALFVLRQAGATSVSPTLGAADGGHLIATANGASSPIVSAGDGNLTQARAKITKALFGSNALDPTAMKVRLMERLGEAFGISMNESTSPRAFGAAIREAIGQLKLRDGDGALAAIEKDLGLDELGISLDTLVGALMEPGGNDDEKLDAALRKKAGEDTEDNRGSEAQAAVARLQSYAIDPYGL